MTSTGKTISVATALALGGSPLSAGLVTVPNGSFESPTTAFVTISVDSWQKTPKPDWYIEDGGFTWAQLTGGFVNTATNQPDHINNCDGTQAIWLFAVPEVGLFQDYNSMDSNDTEPTHAFDSKFQTGKAYCLTFGAFVGTSAGIPMQQGVTMAASLYYRDAMSNRLEVASTVVTNTGSVTSNRDHFLTFALVVPPVQSSDAWAGQNIGIQLLSTVSSNMQGGYWVLDNVRLREFDPPTFTSPAWADGQFQCLIESEPGLAFEILAATNIASSVSEWSSEVTLTNITGATPFIDTSGIPGQRFYRARFVP